MVNKLSMISQESRELMVLEFVNHIRMARAQQAFYQKLVEDSVKDSVSDAEAGKEHAINNTHLLLITAQTWNSRFIMMSNLAVLNITTH